MATAQVNPRPPFVCPKTVVKHVCPVSQIQAIYNASTDDRQKQACLRYLLQYQHYNAEYTEEQNELLGYPKPLTESQMKPGYIRTEYAQFIQLAQPFIDDKLSHFFVRSFKPPDIKETISANDFVKLSNRSAFGVLSMLYASKVSFKEISELTQEDLKEVDHQKDKKLVIKVKLEPCQIFDDKTTAFGVLDKRLKSLNLTVNIKSKQQKLSAPLLRTSFKDCQFLFYLDAGDGEVSIMWGVKWACPKKNNQLCCLTLPQLMAKFGK